MAGNHGLGTLTLSLIAKIGGFTAPLDKAGRDLDKRARAMEKRAEALGRAIGTSLKVGAGIAAAGLALYVKNTIEAEKVQAQLAARIRDTGGAAGRSIAQLNAQADALQRSTVFDDESIGEAQAALLTFTQVAGETFDRTIEAATDLATVMGTDVADAAKVLGKALSDPEAGLGALRKAGIVLTEDQAKLVKQLQDTGDVAGAQAVILDALADKMGTAAEASRNTLGGALQALQNSFDNLLEGDANDNGMRGARDAIEHLNDSLNDPGLKQGVDNLVKDFAFVAEKAALAVTAIANLTQGVDAFGRTASQAQYDANLRKEQVLKDQIANGGRSPFEPGGYRSVAALQADLAQVKRENAAYRAALQNAPAPAAPANVMRSGETQTIHHDPSLWNVPGASSGGGGGRGSSGPSKAAVDAARAQEEAIRDLLDAHNDLNSVLEDQARQLGGPSLDAAYDYKAAMVEIEKTEETLSRLGKLDADAQAQIAQARAQATDQYNKRIEAIEATKSPLQELLEQQEHEIDLLGLTGAALQTANQLYGQSAEDIAKYGDAIAANNEKIEQTRELAGHMDEVRASFEDIFTSVAKGQESLLDGLSDFADAVIAEIFRMAAAQASAALFGQPGTTGGGWIGGLVSSFFGNGASGSSSVMGILGSSGTVVPSYAGGTDFHPGGWADVGERGKERVYLPRGSRVVPNHELASSQGGGVVQNINFNLPRRIDNRTEMQIAQAAGRSARMATRRNAG